MEVCLPMSSASESFNEKKILLALKRDCCKHLKITLLKLTKKSAQCSKVYYAFKLVFRRFSLHC